LNNKYSIIECREREEMLIMRWIVLCHRSWIELTEVELEIFIDVFSKQQSFNAEIKKQTHYLKSVFW